MHASAPIGAANLREQLDLFDLLAPPTAAPNPPARRLTHVEKIYAIAFSEKVKSELVQFANARAGEWLSGRDFHPVIDKHGISSCFGHVLSHLARAGTLLTQECCWGSDKPGNDNYFGYENRYAAIGTEGPSRIVNCASAEKKSPRRNK